MRRTAYFDTNVFDHIHKKIDFTEKDKVSLQSAVDEGKICILLSILNIEEVTSAIGPRPDLAVAELKLILDLADCDRLLKSQDQLIRDDIICYAQCEPMGEPFVTDSVILSNLQALRDPNDHDVSELRVMVTEIREQKEEFMAGMREGREKLLPHVEKLDGWRPTFEEYWESLAEKFAEAFAGRADSLEGCRKRGIKGLLDVRSVRLAVGASLSLTYSQTFEGRTPKIGDSRDNLHAILAAPADTFVTQDSAFAALLSRIPIEGWEVMDLRGLLGFIR